MVRCTQQAGRCRCVGAADEAVLGSPRSVPFDHVCSAESTSPTTSNQTTTMITTETTVVTVTAPSPLPPEVTGEKHDGQVASPASLLFPSSLSSFRLVFFAMAPSWHHRLCPSPSVWFSIMFCHGCSLPLLFLISPLFPLMPSQASLMPCPAVSSVSASCGHYRVKMRAGQQLLPQSVRFPPLGFACGAFHINVCACCRLR